MTPPILTRILTDIDDCRYRLEEARGEGDARDRLHHNAGVDAAERVVRRVFAREQTMASLRELRDAHVVEPQLPRHWLAGVP